MARGRQANAATGAFGGAPYGATKRCTGCVKRREEGEERGVGGGGGGGEKRRRRTRGDVSSKRGPNTTG
eukprot:3253422-Pyramimonas_sp.AAC.1